MIQEWAQQVPVRAKEVPAWARSPGWGTKSGARKSRSRCARKYSGRGIEVVRQAHRKSQSGHRCRRGTAQEGPRSAGAGSISTYSTYQKPQEVVGSHKRRNGSRQIVAMQSVSAEVAQAGRSYSIFHFDLRISISTFDFIRNFFIHARRTEWTPSVLKRGSSRTYFYSTFWQCVQVNFYSISAILVYPRA